VDSRIIAEAAGAQLSNRPLVLPAPPGTRTLRATVRADSASPNRSFLIWTLIVLATLSTLGASLTIWTKRQLLDTNQWTKSSSQLLADRNIRSFIAQQLVERLHRALPSQLKNIAPAATIALENVSVRSVNTFLGTAQAQALWRETNRKTQRALVSVLEGKDVGLFVTERGEVVLDLNPLLLQVAKQLGVARRLEAHLSPTTGKIVLVRADQLRNAQRAVHAIRLLSVWLVLLAVALYGLAFFLAKGHRHGTLEVSGISVVLVGLLLLIVRRLVGNAIVDSYVQTESYRPAVRSAWLIETRLLREIAIVLIVCGAAVIVAGFLGGLSRPARAIRR
jgi:hypothetical protein